MNPYNAVRYPSLPKEQTHPDRLATVAILHGLSPAPVERCRVLELGCGTAGNLLPMAYVAPESEFVGVDKAEEPIRDGAAVAAELGLANIRLLAADIMEIGAELGEFDYIIAHGVYSWVPEPVRDRLVALCAERLAPNGVAYISYNALPGGYLRRIARDMMLYHTAAIEDPDERVRQARALVALAAQAQPDAGMRREFEVVLERSPSVIYHDDLAPENHAVYFHEFARHAEAHGLQFLDEAGMVAAEGQLPEPVRAALRPLEQDPVRREQYLDFMRLRRFRQTLLCRAGLAVERPVRPECVRALYAASKAQPAGPPEGPSGAIEFRNASGAAAKTVHPVAKAALALLGSVWPRRLAFDEILREISGDCAAAERDAAALAEILWQTCRCGLVELHAWPGNFAAAASERPVASALARLALREGLTAATLTHGVVEMDDEKGRRLVSLLDGTRDRAALAAELGAPLSAVDHNLAELARLPLLIA